MTTIARNTGNDVRIRLATPEDAAAICAIYAPYVLETAITFDTQPPSVEDMTHKITATLAERPFLVAERTTRGENDEAAKADERSATDRGAKSAVLGFSYASAFRPRAAYIHAIETSVYLHPDTRGLGLGRRLYTALENILRLQNVYTANACISYIEPADEYSPTTSRLFHERMGYTQCAHIPNCGRKFDRWYGIIWMQKELSPLPDEPGDFIPLPALDPDDLERILAAA